MFEWKQYEANVYQRLDDQSIDILQIRKINKTGGKGIGKIVSNIEVRSGS